MARLRLLLLASLLAVLALGGTVTSAPAGGKIGPHLVFDYNSGRVYSQNNAFDRWYPASLTKVMTAYTVFREIRKGRISLLSPVRISAYARSKPPSKIGYPEGTILNVDAALKIIMVKSANDVSTALAESVAGSEEEFVSLMNAYARELGMVNSRFTNPHGLHDPDQYSSARDLGILARQIYREFPREAGYFAIPAIKVGETTMRNHNQLLQRFPGTIGMKTGYVCAAGLNIVVSAKLRGKTFIAVVLGGESGKDRNVEAARLLTEASRKSMAFSLPKIDSLGPPGGVVRPPVDMRPVVCDRRNREAGEEEESEDTPALAAFAPKEPTLDELEELYMLPKGADTRVIPIVLGNATGPDPYGLVTPVDAAAPAVAAAQEGAGTDVRRDPENPEIVILGNGKRITVPEPRPLR